jgi:pimeloyl-ACP methyl ester carboxylesterase
MGCQISNHKWIRGHRLSLEAKSEMIKTPLGNLEYSKRGEPPYILVLHGAPGHHDGLKDEWGTEWGEKGFGVIAPSRPGYGRSSRVASYDEQADQYKHLLDELGVKKVAAILGVSGGGPSACRFAIKYPDHLNCLLLQVAVTGNFVSPYIKDMKSPATKVFFTSTTIARMMQGNRLEKIVPGFLQTVSKMDKAAIQVETKEIINDPRRAKVVRKSNNSNVANPAYCQNYDSINFEIGLFNTELNLSQVKTPTFIVHGDEDNIVNVSQGE